MNPPQSLSPAKVGFHPPVFYPASVLILALLGFAAVAPDTAERFFKALQAVIVTNGSWFYVLTVAIILITVIFLGLSRYGEIKLGPDHSEPDYGNLTWFAMLFSAGMGIGLMFFGVAEPVMHFLSPPVGEAGTVEAARAAMKITFFHWGLHAWAIYAIVALILAFFSYRHGLPLTLRSALYPMIGERIYGPIGHAVDVFAVIGTVFGVATSLGYGVMQVNAGLNHLFGLPVGTTTQIVLIIAVTGLAMLSVATGLDKGIRILSELNMGMAVLLLVLMVILGPTVFLLQAFVQNTGSYVADLVSKTFNLFAYEKTDWIGGWTILYWGWWMSWAPFVGLFIARVSRGRTIREFAMGVLFVPTGFTLMWMTVFGNSAIELILHQGQAALGEAVQADVALALFAFLENFPFSGVLSLLATVMVVVFFVTSSDSGSMVVDMLCSRGHDNTQLWQRIYWAGGEGVVAIVLLLVGGLGALQTMTIASALPFAVVLLIATYGLIKALRIDLYKRASLQVNVAPMGPPAVTGSWKNRLHNIIDYPTREVVHRFIAQVARPACQEVAAELNTKGIEAKVTGDGADQVILSVSHGDEIDFVYQVLARAHVKPAFLSPDVPESELGEAQKYYRAEIHLREGGQDYDIMGWSSEAVISDIIDQYHKHMHFLHLLR
ncbi:BCCT family transporter [Denitromonas iodatirespirans]|uniref:Choline BCCT transporter BetT n=1 Tax=Denitromonas iodatirespirans TaxID=2795389 RepID=A0A944HA33_DENI1|nr:choline BCCT transporter BetT [Denitromonas iodatirespirans]MBT0964118.1 choline BCCT transporter BetT [Denitromonas iodatirespirans]